MVGYGHLVPHRSAPEILSLATNIRRLCKVSDGPFPIIEFLEVLMPRLDERFLFEVQERRELGNNHGLMDPLKNGIYLREDVYDGAVKGRYRDRVTAAHELGHYFLHLNVPVQFNFSPVQKRLKPEVNSESQANLFAAALLISERWLVRCKSLDDAAQKFSASKSSVQLLNNVLIGLGRTKKRLR